MEFVGCELQVARDLDRPRVVEGLQASPQAPYLILSTCQRLECYGFHVPQVELATVVGQHREAEAFARIARIAAGLESRILGELEILGQVREAYKTFRTVGGSANPRLDRIFQDVLSAAREARRISGIDTQMTSLSGLASRMLMEQVTADFPVCVVGTGSLAASVARYLRKRGNYPLRITSRCPENALALASELGCFASGLDNLAHLFDGVHGIISATAAPHAIIYPHHLERVARPLHLIDLGAPADCAPEVAAMDGIRYIPLTEVEERAQVNSEDRVRRGQIAADVIREAAAEWSARRNRSAA